MALRLGGDRHLKTLDGLTTRPTPSRVREAMFNIWQNRVQNCRWLDLCAGSGAMGAEALWHDASYVVGVEQAGAACHLIQANWQHIDHTSQRFALHRGDVLKILPKLASMEPFDLIYFDPPYASDLYAPVLNMLSTLCHADTAIAVEHNKKRRLPREIANLVVVDVRNYGQTAITFYELAI
jgi:16S rRNA (guanine966-N2)-methyltransferase